MFCLIESFLFSSSGSAFLICSLCFW
jgi:hypothetical protein